MVEDNQNKPMIRELKSKVLIFDQDSPGPVPPLHLSAQLVVDCEQIAMVAAQAYCARGNIQVLSIYVYFLPNDFSGIKGLGCPTI